MNQKNKYFFFTIFIPLFIGALIYILNIKYAPIRNYLPDFLWAFSFYSSIRIFNSTIQNSYIILICTLFSLFYEIGQSCHLFKGTFDYLDLFFYMLGILSSFIILKNKF